MSDSKTPFNKELITLLMLFSFLVLWTLKAHSQPSFNEVQKNEKVENLKLLEVSAQYPTLK